MRDTDTVATTERQEKKLQSRSCSLTLLLLLSFYAVYSRTIGGEGETAFESKDLCLSSVEAAVSSEPSNSIEVKFLHPPWSSSPSIFFPLLFYLFFFLFSIFFSPLFSFRCSVIELAIYTQSGTRLELHRNPHMQHFFLFFFL